MSHDQRISSDERSHWNRRYRESDAATRAPDRFLVEAFDGFIQPAFPEGGDALDVAGGAGRHAVYLAQRGWRVTLTDISEAGIAKAQAAARDGGVELQFLLGDTRHLEFGCKRFDLALGFYYLDRPTFPKMAQALRPGGLVVYQTFTREHRKFQTMGATKPTYFLDRQELRQAFPNFELLFYDEDSGERGLARLIAKKPVEL
jgi:tellurite methyltransferase